MYTFIRSTLLAVAMATLAACGGGGGGGTAAPQTATVGIALTDDPSLEFDQALATITSIDLLGEDGRVNVFTGEETVDLLKLADYSELFAVRDDVPAGTYSKIRLQLSNLELNNLNDNGDVVETVTPKLVGNGKLDLNPQGPFFIAPGSTVVATIDFDVGKSLKITETGNGKLIVRPVVFVDITTHLPSPGLTRIHGVVSDLSDDGSFRLCQTRLASSDDDDFDSGRFDDDGHCVRVHSDSATGIFGDNGEPQDFADLENGDEVTAIGRLQPIPRPDDDDDDNDDEDDDENGDDDNDAERFALNAVVIEEGPLGTFKRLRGTVSEAVDSVTDRFQLQLEPGQGVVSDESLAAQLYPKSRIFAPNGVELGRLDIEVGTSALVDSVLVVSSTEPDLLRTALVVLDVDGATDEQVLSGPLVSVDAGTGQLIVADSAGDRCVDAQAADVFLVDDDNGVLESQRGTLGDLEVGQEVNVFGHDGPGGCLVAETILADV